VKEIFMSYRKPHSLKHRSLPIVGHTLTNIATEPLVALIFNAPGDLVSLLRFEHDVILTSPASGTTVIIATKPGLSFDPAAAYQSLSPLIGEIIVSALAQTDGKLELAFGTGSVLRVHPDNYEAWHFQQPAPFTQPRYATPLTLLTGYGGGLL
jgi:hypothetical protein